MIIQHTPVLLDEAIQGLNLSAGQQVIDGTAGGGGHAEAILKAIGPQGKLMAFDRDPQAIQVLTKKLKDYSQQLILINDSYSQLEIYVKRYKFNRLAGLLLDLGFSSTQLADRTRGFSFQISGTLDLRYNPRTGLSAAELLNTVSPAELERIFKASDVPQFRRLTKAIVQERRRQPFRTTDDLLKVVQAVKGYGHRSLHPATLVWQALRLEVNHELEELAAGLTAASQALARHGRLVVISFHSGEDRLVKNFFRTESRACLCPPYLPSCRCQHKPSLKIITKKALTPSAAELAKNPRAASAKLRIAEKI